MTVYYYHQRILTFLTGQLLGSLLDSTVLLFFLPVMFFLSPLVTTFILMICAVIVAWLVLTLPIYRRKGKWLEALQSERGSFLYQTLAGIRTVKALTLEPRQRHRFDALTHKVAKSRIEHDLFGAVVATVVRPLEMAAISGGLAVAVYICMTTEDPTLTASARDPAVDPDRHVAQSVGRCAHRHRGARGVGQSAGGGRALARRAAPDGARARSSSRT
jgi:ABC-type protease/lipase transport system fused ATPase/permease subunit